MQFTTRTAARKAMKVPCAQRNGAATSADNYSMSEYARQGFATLGNLLLAWLASNEEEVRLGHEQVATNASLQNVRRAILALFALLEISEYDLIHPGGWDQTLDHLLSEGAIDSYTLFATARDALKREIRSEARKS